MHLGGAASPGNIDYRPASPAHCAYGSECEPKSGRFHFHATSGGWWSRSARGLLKASQPTRKAGLLRCHQRQCTIQVPLRLLDQGATLFEQPCTSRNVVVVRFNKLHVRGRGSGGRGG